MTCPARLKNSPPALMDILLLGAPVPGDDTQLLSLCRRYMSLNRRQEQLGQAQCAANEAGDKELEEATLSIQRRFVSYGHRLLAELMELPATTPAGLRAKAEVAATIVNHDSDGCPMFEDMPLWSLCQDLLASRGASA